MSMSMRAIVQFSPGAADTLRVGTADMPRLGPGQLLVRVMAAGVNRADIVQRQGHYPPPPGSSTVLGLEVSGEVVETGAGDVPFAVGEQVFGLVPGGGYAEYALLDACCALHKPEWLDHAQAASLPEAWMTAWLNLVEVATLQAGETILVHAGASGVGIAAIQLARIHRAKVLATAGSDAKCEFALRHGAEMAINYRHADFADAVRQAGGVDVILDCVGGSYLERNIAALNQDGRLVVIGTMGASSGQLDMRRLLVKRLAVRGSTLRSQPLAIKQRLTRALAQEVLPALIDGRARITLDRTFPWEAVAAAHEYMEASNNLGKVVLIVAVA